MNTKIKWVANYGDVPRHLDIFREIDIFFRVGTAEDIVYKVPVSQAASLFWEDTNYLVAWRPTKCVHRYL